MLYRSIHRQHGAVHEPRCVRAKPRDSLVNETRLQGRWDFLLKFTPDESQVEWAGIKILPPSHAADAPPPLFTAIPEQIGLKFEAGKAEVPVLVIDHVEPPSPNGRHQAAPMTANIRALFGGTRKQSTRAVARPAL